MLLGRAKHLHCGKVILRNKQWLFPGFHHGFIWRKEISWVSARRRDEGDGFQNCLVGNRSLYIQAFEESAKPWIQGTAANAQAVEERETGANTGHGVRRVPTALRLGKLCLSAFDGSQHSRGTSCLLCSSHRTRDYSVVTTIQKKLDLNLGPTIYKSGGLG